MADNYLRTCTVALDGGPTITGGGSTDLRIAFRIFCSTIQTPNAAEIRIYNPSPSTAAQFKNKTGKVVTLTAGYESNSGVIYKGQIKQTIFRKEDPVTTYVVLYCADSDNAYRQARLDTTLAAGHTPQDRVDAALKAMSPFGVSPTLGVVNVDLCQPKYPRGIPLVGVARDTLRLVASSAGATWSTHQGQVHIVNPQMPVQGTPAKLNSATGLIGMPEQTEDGIIVRSLINPAFAVDTLVQIDQASIQQEAPDYQSVTSEASYKSTYLPIAGFIAADGIYRVIFMDTIGDTRGQEWYQNMTVIAVNGGAPSPNGAHTSPFGYPYVGRAG